MDEETIHHLEPPASRTRKLENPFLLVLQIIHLLIIFIPVIVYSLIKDVFFTEPKCLKGKTVLVTGSGRGLGQGFALKFAQLGCKVACADVDEDGNNETVQMINQQHPGNAKGYTCNVANSLEIRDLKKAIENDFGYVDIVVHNAAVIIGGRVTDFDDVFLHGVIAVNLTSHFFLIREFLPDMLKRNDGHIVAVSSTAGFAGASKLSMYTATKHGIFGLMESLHYELQEIPDNNVRTSVICPWFVNTSQSYNKAFHTRIPEWSITEMVDAAVDGVRRNKRIIAIPSFMYYFAHLNKFFPDHVNKIIRDIFYVKFIPPSMELLKTSLRYKTFIKSVKEIDFGLERS